MESHELAYLAGIIDGEGYVGHASKGAGRGNEFMIHVNMTDRGTIELLHAAFGGSVRLRPSQNPRWQDQHVWRVKCKKAEAAYAALLPYLRIKRLPR